MSWPTSPASTGPSCCYRGSPSPCSGSIPLVWVLAREAHQLREEAADDAVLGADIEDTDYAKLLVGVARHECRGLLIGAHGVAPGRNSLSRRVRRVLDSSLARGPIGGAFALGVFVGAAMLAAPLAALTLTSKPAPVAPPAALAQATQPQRLTIRALPRRSWHRPTRRLRNPWLRMPS